KRRALEVAHVRTRHNRWRNQMRCLPARHGRRRIGGNGGRAAVGHSGRILGHGSHWTRLTKSHFDSLDTLELGGAAPKQCLRIVGLNPVLQELHRDGHTYRLPVEVLEFHRVEPTRIDILAQLGTKHFAYLVPPGLLSTWGARLSP